MSGDDSFVYVAEKVLDWINWNLEFAYNKLMWTNLCLNILTVLLSSS